MKKTCERCKALILDNSKGGICTLGYKHEDYKPLEECPKPLNQTQLADAEKAINPVNYEK